MPSSRKTTNVKVVSRKRVFLYSVWEVRSVDRFYPDYPDIKKFPFTENGKERARRYLSARLSRNQDWTSRMVKVTRYRIIKEKGNGKKKLSKGNGRNRTSSRRG